MCRLQLQQLANCTRQLQPIPRLVCFKLSPRVNSVLHIPPLALLQTPSFRTAPKVYYSIRRYSVDQNLPSNRASLTSTVTCKECDLIFVDQNGLNQHTKAKHARKIPCKRCAKFFKTEARLQQHYATKHGIPRLKCDECCRYFSGQQALDEHQNSPEEESKFSCGECDMAFGTQCDLDQHYLAAHSDTRSWRDDRTEARKKKRNGVLRPHHNPQNVNYTPLDILDCEDEEEFDEQDEDYWDAIMAGGAAQYFEDLENGFDLAAAIRDAKRKMYEKDFNKRRRSGGRK